MAGERAHSRILDRYLLPQEEVIVAIRHHWGRMIEPVASAFGAFVLAVWCTINTSAGAGVIEFVTVVLCLALALRMAWRAFEWRNEWFVATDKRLLKTYGLITHRIAMMPLRKVTDMNYARSPLGRVLGYGQFIMESAGQDQAMREINWVPDPDVTYRRICDTIFGPGGHDPDEDGAEPELDHTAYSEDTEPAWEVSHDAEEPYTPAGYWQDYRGDPDTTGPIPPPRR